MNTLKNFNILSAHVIKVKFSSILANLAKSAIPISNFGSLHKPLTIAHKIVVSNVEG